MTANTTAGKMNFTSEKNRSTNQIRFGQLREFPSYKHIFLKIETI